MKQRNTSSIYSTTFTNTSNFKFNIIIYLALPHLLQKSTILYKDESSAPRVKKYALNYYTCTTSTNFLSINNMLLLLAIYYYNHNYI